ncbi:Protein of unknown function [Pseudobutyrivibrio sp. ACV-2]|uniref:DUF1292 domain-containing protein n=1 Tax=Pseudobutyrivibrio sp. ACV-2 TaxID=1520801 RepID=UPI00089D92ED|nr:DUF1292 domain-containing protein [Pseudobutyrivibrio sp. ACV-2]SDZ78422.1 Protein of unknown function [Pseudobutyrivibrio sp. ACV-2]
MDKIIFTGDDGENIEFFVIEETVVSGNKYLLVCDNEDEEEAEATILKEINADGEEAVYEFVEDDVEFAAVAKLFDELVGEDADIDY